MRSPRRRQLFWKGTDLVLALGAAGGYVWQAHHRSILRHVSGTKRPDYLIAAPPMRLSGTKNITQPVFATRTLSSGGPVPASGSAGPLMRPGSSPEELWQVLPAGKPLPASGPGRLFREKPVRVLTSQGEEIFLSTKSGVPLIRAGTETRKPAP